MTTNNIALCSLMVVACPTTFIILMILIDNRHQRLKRDGEPDNPNDPSSNRESRRSLNANQKHQHPTEEQHRSNAEAHWRKQIRIERIALMLSIVATGAAIAAGVGAWYAYAQAKRQADAAIAAADTASDQAENMDRPWIKMVDLERPDISFTGPGMATQFGFSGEEQEVFFNGSPRIRNVGKTTAVHVHVRIKFVIHKWANGWGDFSLEQKAACADAQAMNVGYDATLFPDDPFDGFGIWRWGLSVAGKRQHHWGNQICRPRHRWVHRLSILFVQKTSSNAIHL